MTYISRERSISLIRMYNWFEWQTNRMSLTTCRRQQIENRLTTILNDWLLMACQSHVYVHVYMCVYVKRIFSRIKRKQNNNNSNYDIISNRQPSFLHWPVAWGTNCVCTVGSSSSVGSGWSVGFCDMWLRRHSVLRGLGTIDDVVAPPPFVWLVHECR